jgi:AraC-like DNA-binding protein
MPPPKELPVRWEGKLGLRLWSGRLSGPMACAHTHPDVEINLLRSGRMDYFHAGRREVVEPGQLCVFWGGIPHQTLDKTAGEGFWATLPVGWLLRWKRTHALRERLFTGAFVREPDPRAPYAREDLPRLARWLEDYRSDEPARLDVLALEVEARLSRLALHQPVDHHHLAGARDHLSRHLEAMTAYLSKHYTGDIAIEDVARAARLNPTYAMETFKRGCGMSLWDYLVRLRLAHAQRLLLTTDRKVLVIALEAGFASASAFYYNFKKHVGDEPRRFRERAGA